MCVCLRSFFFLQTGPADPKNSGLNKPGGSTLTPINEEDLDTRYNSWPTLPAAGTAAGDGLATGKFLEGPKNDANGTPQAPGFAMADEEKGEEQESKTSVRFRGKPR